jgi:hypothetical protein
VPTHHGPLWAVPPASILLNLKGNPVTLLPA